MCPVYSDIKIVFLINIIWLVVLTILKKYESQWEGLSLWKINNVGNHQPVMSVMVLII